MRECGVLMHITSLPGPYGIGTMGARAYRFVDFLNRAGQSCWQILPLTPTGYGDSPYQSCSTYAGNHYLIDLPLLMEQGLLEAEDLEGLCWETQPGRVDFGVQYRLRLDVLRRAAARFTDEAALEQFCRDSGSWLPDFALFMALKDENGGKPWYEWPEKLKFRDPDAVWQARQRLHQQIHFYSFVQYEFHRQWTALREYAHGKGVKIIGDVPIYVPLDSADVWSNPELFQLDGNLDPIAVAGCPPDAFTADGQLWGNPLYRWDEMAKDGYNWWIRRLAAAGSLYDVVRMDHFRGLESYWAVPAGDTNARGGKWVKGPGLSFVNAVKQALPELSMIAEDLGYLTQEVLDLRDASGFPGMKVLQFAFDSREPSDYLPHNFQKHTVCYTGTHDNMTMRQWFETAPTDAVAYAREYMALTEAEGYAWGTIRTALSSVSDLCVIQAQDILNLGADARMNFPGTLSSSNWTWRAGEDAFPDSLAEKLLSMARLYGRVAPKEKEPRGETPSENGDLT